MVGDNAPSLHMPAPLAVDWREVETLAVAIGVREAARRMGLSEEAVMKRCSREGWLTKQKEVQERVEAMRVLKREEQGLSAAVRNGVSAAEVLREMPRTTKAVANNLALRALERLEAKSDDDLLSEVTTDVATKWIGNAAKAGSWDADAPKTALVSLSFNAAPLVPLEMVADVQMDVSPIQLPEGQGEAASVDPMDDPAF